MTKRTGLPFAAVAKTLNILLTFCKHFFYTECKLHDSKNTIYASRNLVSMDSEDTFYQIYACM